MPLVRHKRRWGFSILRAIKGRREMTPAESIPKPLVHEIYDGLRAKRPPLPRDLLYHYTTQAGLLGIIESGALWASNVRYLNDRGEFGHAMGIAEKLLPLDGATSKDLRWHMRRGGLLTKTHHIF